MPGRPAVFNWEPCQDCAPEFEQQRLMVENFDKAYIKMEAEYKRQVNSLQEVVIQLGTKFTKTREKNESYRNIIHRLKKKLEAYE